jgi:hypothetical protein
VIVAKESAEPAAGPAFIEMELRLALADSILEFVQKRLGFPVRSEAAEGLSSYVFMARSLLNSYLAKRPYGPGEPEDLLASRDEMFRMMETLKDGRERPPVKAGTKTRQ